MKTVNHTSAPTWADVSTTDVPAAKRFYQDLFGWTGSDVPMEEAGGYGMFTLGEEYVGGYGPCMAPGQPVAWSAYFRSDDADATAAKVTENGGTVIAPPMDVFESGRLAYFTDPEGAAFGIWQPKEHKGFGVYDEPGAVCWFELLSREADRAKTFYRAVFGWDADTCGNEGGGSYTEWKLGGEPLGGMMHMADEGFPPEIPAHWMVYFAVEDCDATAARARELGAAVAVAPTSIPPGRFAVLRDPQGGHFSVIAASGAA